MRFDRSSTLAASILLVAASALAVGKSDKSDKNPLKLLHGEYFFTQTNHCVTTSMEALPPTFDPDTLELLGPAQQVTFQSNGETTFDGKGGISVVGSVMVILDGQVAPGDSPIIPPGPFECSGTYAHLGNRQFDAALTCAGPDFSVENIHIGIAVGKDRDAIIFSDAAPTIERLVAGDFVFAERICIAMATDVKAKN